MTKAEAARQNHQEATLLNLGFTMQEAEALRRISMTLRRWYEHECNGNIERDGDNADGAPYWSSPDLGRHRLYRIPDRERGAEKRLRAIISARNQRVISDTSEPATINGCAAKVADVSLGYYLQGDPRGAVHYIIRPGDVPEGQDVHGYYTRGICVY